MKKLILILILPTLLHFSVLAQTLDAGTQKIIDERLQSLKEAQSTNDLVAICRYNKEIAEIYQKKRILSKSIDYYSAAIDAARKANNTTLLRLLSLKLSDVYSQSGKYSNALPTLLEANKIGEQLQIGKKVLYTEKAEIASLYRKTGQNQKALDLLLELYNKILFQAYDKQLLNYCINEIIKSAKAVGDTKNYDKFIKIKNQQKINATKEKYEEKTSSLVNAVHESNKKIQEKDLALNAKQKALLRTRDSLRSAQVEKEKAALQLEVKNSKLKLKETELEKEKLKNRLLIGGLLFLLLVTGIITYLSLQLKKKNVLLAGQNEKIKKQNEEIESKNIQLKEKNKQIQKQQELQNSAIKYAKSIQMASLPSDKILSKDFEFFKVYLPRDVVSGDFYWFAKVIMPNTKKAAYFYAAVDCTGHGVPGAFMSMIGNRLLNEIIYQKEILDPKEILHTLNIELQVALNQSESNNDDGMDVALCRIIKNENNNFDIVYCGANRPLIYYLAETKELKYERGTTAAIGGLEGKRFNEEFENINHELKKDDLIYLTSDGFVDQNNSQRKKFGTKNLLKLLKNVAELRIEAQKSQIESALMNYKEDTKQRDDITILGIKL